LYRWRADLQGLNGFGVETVNSSLYWASVASSKNGKTGDQFKALVARSLSEAGRFVVVD
jgi:hypothetical protein